MQFIFAALLLTLCCALGQSKNESLSLFYIQPCNGTVNQTVSRYKSDIYTVIQNYSLCFNETETWTKEDMEIGLRIVSWANTSILNETGRGSVVFVSRQAVSGVVSSWNIPLKPEGFDQQFDQVNRTMCPCSGGEGININDSNLFIDVFSSSTVEVQYSISIELVPDYFIKLNESITTIVAPSSPQIHYFKFPNDSSTVTVEASAENNNICAFVSVQNNTCPVNDLLRNALSRGIYQTMNSSAYLTVQASDVIERQFVLVLITTTYSHCNFQPIPPNSSLGYDEYRQEITVVIKDKEPISRYTLAIFFPVFLFCINVIFVSIICCLPRIYFSINLRKCRFKIYSECPCSKEEYVSHNTDSSSSSGVSYGSSTNHKVTPETVSNSSPEHSHGKKDYNERTGLLGDSLLHSVNMETDENKLMLPRMCKIDYEKLNRQYSVYSWNTITVGIFYALPAFQLVLSEQQILRTSGNQDRCYYNFKCTHPLGVLTAFNNQWSNAGYVFLGMLFLAIIYVKKYLYERKRRNDKVYMNNHGIPQFFGIYQAMGLALIMEGFMSAFYHICPTGANFQFDTAFMFILGGLFLVKLLQNRHPDINANAFIAFFSFAIIIFMTLIGIYLDSRSPIAVRLTMFVIVLTIVAIFFFSFYRFHDWNKGSLLSLLKTFSPRPKHMRRFCILIATFLVNILLMPVVMVTKLDVATSILGFFVVNLMLFLFFYLVQKLYFCETITVLPVFLVVIVLSLWLAAFYFFQFNATSDWQATPAKSRTMNHECVLFGFYDYHDIWHFLSAHAMFYSFLFLLTLDDGLMDTKREKIHIF